MAQKKTRTKIIVIVGPTSSGKSALAVELARKFDGEVISADSRQVYRGLDIGTGKITRREMKGVPHHLLDVVSPKRTFTAHDFALLAHAACSSVLPARRSLGAGGQNTRIPIICGGTGFYIDVLLGRIALPDVPADPPLRARLAKRSTEQLFALLQQRDPRRAKTIEPHNKRRLIRALEIARASHRGRFSVTENLPLWSGFQILWIGLSMPPEKLRRRIAIRLFARIRGGMIAEAKRLHKNGLSYKRMHELGLEYRSLARFLQKEITRAELERELKTAIWRYAKRQMTYWRRNKDIKWFPPRQAEAINAEVRKFLSNGQ